VFEHLLSWTGRVGGNVKQACMGLYGTNRKCDARSHVPRHPRLVRAQTRCKRRHERFTLVEGRRSF
jgi:hypothetical protein